MGSELVKIIQPLADNNALRFADGIAAPAVATIAE